MANLFLLSRKAFVMCYCFRAPIKTFFFDACQMTVKSCVLHLFPVPRNRKKPYNKHLISLVFSVRTVNYGSSFFPSIYKSMEKISVRNLQYGPKTRLIRGITLFIPWGFWATIVKDNLCVSQLLDFITHLTM